MNHTTVLKSHVQACTSVCLPYEVIAQLLEDNETESI